MLVLRLPTELDAALASLAKAARQTTAEYARRVLLDHLEDIEDAALADERIRTDTGERISLEEVMTEFAEDLAAHPADGQPGPAKP